MNFAYGPKILLDPLFALTLDEMRIKFKANNKISKDASLLLVERDVFFENLDLGNETMICTKGAKMMEGPIVFEPSTDQDIEIYRIRGYKPKNL